MKHDVSMWAKDGYHINPWSADKYCNYFRMWFCHNAEKNKVLFCIFKDDINLKTTDVNLTKAGAPMTAAGGQAGASCSPTLPQLAISRTKITEEEGVVETKVQAEVEVTELLAISSNKITEQKQVLVAAPPELVCVNQEI